MLQLFRNNQLYTIAAVFCYMLIFYAQQWMQGDTALLPEYRQTAGILTEKIYFWIADYPALVRLIFAGLLMLQALIINNIVQEHRLSKRPTYFTAIFYILLVFLLNKNEGLSPAFIANTFILFSLNNLYQSYEKSVSMAQIFNVGFGISIAMLFYHAAEVYIIWAMISLWILRSLGWKEAIIAISGFFIPLFWMFTYQFWTDNLGNWWNNAVLVHYGWHWAVQIDNWVLLGLGVMGLIALWSLANGQAIYYKTTIKEQKSINVIFWMLWIAPLSLVAQNHIFTEHFNLAIIPLAILLSLNFQTISRNAIAELLHLLLFMACLLTQYSNFFGA